MAGLTKPTEQRETADEEGQSLLASASSYVGSSPLDLTSSSSPRARGSSRRGLGSSSSSSSISAYYFNYLKFNAHIYKRIGLLVGVLVLAAAYKFGRERGYTSLEEALIDGDLPDESALYGKEPTPSSASGGVPPTNPPFPTYKPTPVATPATVLTPQPTFGNQSWVDPDPNPYVPKFNTTEWNNVLNELWEKRIQNSVEIKEKYGTYCSKNEEDIARCPPLDETGGILDRNNLSQGPTLNCIETGNKEQRCGVNNPWLNKTIWPLLRGPFCAAQDEVRKKQMPLPDELKPYFELGYDREDPTKSKDADPFDGGQPTSTLEFDPTKMKEHFLKFEAMLEHYYEGLARPLLEKQLSPTPDDPLYAPMLKAYADQIARVLLRAAKFGGAHATKMVVGVLGDSVTSGTDNCYYDAWPEVFRRQISPLFAAMGVDVEVRNAGKNGGWDLAPQMMCAYDMLGVSDLPEEVGLDFLFLCNNFVRGQAVDAEHMIRRALLGKSHTVVSMTAQDGMDQKWLNQYAAAGFSVGSIYENAPPEMGMTEGGYKFWFPALDRSFWGMQGDGFCHLTTRAGSSVVVKRNWHWGPKLHEIYADAHALLFSRAARQAIDELSGGQTPHEPRKPSDINVVLQEDQLGEKDDNAPTWRKFLFMDMGLDEAVSGGLSGIRCAVGSANQAGSTLLSDWLHPVEGSPFESSMKARNGASFVPSDHDAEGSKFYKVTSPISPPNNAVEGTDWVPHPKEFGVEARRSVEQCRHVDGSTMVNTQLAPDGVSWLVWEVPKGAVSIGRAMICLRNKKVIAEDAFDKGDIRFHYAVPNGTGDWTVSEDVHKSKPMTFLGQSCIPVVTEMNEASLKAARDGGMWVAVEVKKEAIFEFDYLVAM